LVPLFILLAAKGPVDGKGDHGSGFWGAKTASVNWCEADYVVTPYIAEFANTMSSLCICCVGFFGLMMHRGKVEPRYLIAFLAFVVIGVGSAAFHGTLWRSMQLLDELPMIWANSVFIYILGALEDKPERKRTIEIAFIAVVTALMTSAVILLDTDTQDVFLLCYGSGVVYIWYRSTVLDWRYNATGAIYLHEISLLFYGAGFCLWIVDRMFCANVRNYYLHVFWHIFAAIGTFSAVVCWIWLRFQFLGKKPVLHGEVPGAQWVEEGIGKVV